MRFILLLLLALSACVVCIVRWSSLVCMCGCIGTLCDRCGGGGDCAPCDVVCVGCGYDERVPE